VVLLVVYLQLFLRYVRLEIRVSISQFRETESLYFLHVFPPCVAKDMLQPYVDFDVLLDDRSGKPSSLKYGIRNTKSNRPEGSGSAELDVESGR
jgi:hypothetical protein